MSPRAQLAFLGACLSRYPERRAELSAAIGDGLPWPELLQRAGAQLVTPSLAGALADAGLLGRLPEEVRGYLQTVRDLNRTRNAALYGELVRVAAALNAAGIEPQLLKGAAALLPGQYAGAGDRVIGDLDLRIPGGRYADAAEAVHGLGYQFAEGRAVELAAAEHWLHQPYPQALGRPIGAAGALWLVELGQSGRGWHQLLGMLPRWRNLPRRLMRPTWYAIKVQALRRGDPW
jgi:hypothetical protein